MYPHPHTCTTFSTVNCAHQSGTFVTLSESKWTYHVCVLSHLSRVQLCDPMDHSPPGSSVHGILQARTLEWAAKLLFLITQIKVLQLSVI